ncbi:hypothetical protein GPECTOR_46g220 [Gonium pectorale]|uniref:Uncharacterized protein n=1 Tax=Gonium pectorale TaxID=33097 RepID=A0A150G8L2_GONPE|nr:hypothetical protein GPECTOR_46g220 [Gonium pectorale]|eukprot:KXZ46151.1 hypothetical protein GPECTOR_46g220 [Gonium pectorale]
MSAAIVTLISNDGKSDPEDPCDAAPGLWLPLDVIAAIGTHLELEDRLMLSRTCRAWRRALNAGVTVLAHTLDDCTSPGARTHTAAGWGAMLAAAAPLSPAAREARLRVAGNLMGHGSLGTMLAGLAAHTRLTRLDIRQMPHSNSFRLPSRPVTSGSRLRRRGRSARPPATVFPHFNASVLPPLSAALTHLTSLCLRNCLLVEGFESGLSRLTALTRLELVPCSSSYLAPPLFPSQYRFFLEWRELVPLGSSLRHLTLGGQLVSPPRLAMLGAVLPRLRTLRLEAVSASEHSQWSRMFQRHERSAVGVSLKSGELAGPLDLAWALRNAFTSSVPFSQNGPTCAPGPN